jgi:MinD-like ATPase involved in chromosome partitioning or flagellar assembly
MIEQGDTVVRVLLAAGDRELERRLSQELVAEGIVIAARCLDGPSLLERAAEPGIDVVLASANLHHLSEPVLLALRERRRPVVLLAGEGADIEQLATLTRVLPASSSGPIVAAAVRQTESRGAFSTVLDADASMRPVGSTGDSRGQLIAVTSGKGAPGKTTIAIALAALLAAAGTSVVLVDADLRGGNVAPYLDLDPRRGLVGYAASGDGLEEELQDGPGFAVLAGLERPELAEGLREETLSAAVAALRERFERVIVDLGAPPELSLLRVADQLLLVTGADLVSVWNARVRLRGLGESVSAGSLAAVVNRREGREHYDPEEIEHALGIPVLGVVREDRKAARRATAKQLPLSEAGGRAARDLRKLTAALGSSGEQSFAQPESVLASLVGEG